MVCFFSLFGMLMAASGKNGKVPSESGPWEKMLPPDVIFKDVNT